MSGLGNPFDHAPKAVIGPTGQGKDLAKSALQSGSPAYHPSVALILLAEDDEGIRVPLVRALEREGYDVEAVTSGRDAIAAGVDGEHDLLLLDIGLPGADGLEVCQRVREGRPSVPIVFLTVHDGEMDAVGGLDAGADDYITKPFGVEELLARIRATTRRHVQPTPASARIGDFDIDLAKHQVTAPERAAVHLTRIEWRLIELFLAEPGKLFSHRQLLQQVWGPTYDSETQYLRQYIAQLRRKFEKDPARPRHLITESGMGYRFQP
ncbi:MAG TPA: response regulator transcription factor [Micromonosporaceae bacterium]|nr:response regulator transcription factor [Micromonosporaceae bacterium]